MDLVLQRHVYHYGECLSELLSAGIPERVGEGNVAERAGISSVPKKDSSLRLILDTKRSNAHFQEPPRTLLASVEALANLEVDASKGVAVASADVDCCFYPCELPPWARHFFGLLAVQARFLQPEARQLLGITYLSEMVHFVARVAPMGWSWAVHLAQVAHAHILAVVSPESPWIADKAPAFAFGAQCSGAKMLHMDSVAVFASGSGDPVLEVEHMLAALGERGIQASFDSDDGEFHTLLGYVLHKPSATWRLSRSTFWRLKFSFDFVLAPGRLVTERELERLMGHITSAMMLQRPMLSLFHAIYEFCRRTRDRALAHFEEVPAGRLLVEPWTAVAARRRRRAAAIHALGDEGVGWAVRRLVRNAQLHGLRHLVLGGNLEPRPKRITRRASGSGGGRWLPGPSGPRQGWTSRAPVSAGPAWHGARRAHLCPRLSRLAASRVRPATERAYLRALTWLRVKALPEWTPLQWDGALVDYAEWAFDRGMGREAFSRALCAVAWGEPALGGPVRRLFTSAHSSLAGWTRHQPGHSRPPLPRLLALAFAAALASPGKPDSGLCILAMFECYLRPSEATTLLAKQLAAGYGVGVLRSPLLILHPEELAISSKTGEFDSTVAFDLPRHHWIGRAALRLQPLLREDKPLFCRAYSQLFADIHIASQHLKLDALGFAPHCLRRCDKAGRLALALRSLGDERKDERERWAAAAPRLFGSAFAQPSVQVGLENDGRVSTSSQEPAGSPRSSRKEAEWDAAVLREKLERIQDEVHGMAQTQQTSSELERTRQHVSEVLGSLQQQQRQVLEAQERHEEMGALERQQRQWAQEKVAELGGKLKEKDRKILDMGNSLKRTKKRLEELIEETERRKRSLARVEKDRERAATARERLEEQRDQLEEELRSVQQSGEAARVRCEQLQRRCHELERRDQEQRQDISLAEQGRRQEAQELENSEVRRLKALHEAELEDLRGKHSKVLLSIQAERNALTKERQVLEEQLHSVAAEQRQEAESQAERARLCEELSGRLMNAKDAVQRLEEEKRSLQTEARDAQAEHDRLREQRDELARRLRGVEEARRKAEGDRQSMQQ
ncbi:unnamed protein product, partial [Prorocentrum cordatum]